MWYIYLSYEFLIHSKESQTVQKLKKIVNILIQNQLMQQFPIEANVHMTSITRIQLAGKRHIINGLEEAFNNNHTINHVNLLISQLHYLRNFLLTLAKANHDIN